MQFARMGRSSPHLRDIGITCVGASDWITFTRLFLQVKQTVFVQRCDCCFTSAATVLLFLFFENLGAFADDIIVHQR